MDPQGGGMKGHPRALCSCVLQSVVLPRCRGTAEALQITAGHILGDAGSPYLTGLVRDALICGDTGMRGWV